MLSPPLVREKMQKCRHCRKWELGQVNSDGEQRWFIEEVQAHRETAGCSQNVSLRVRWFWIQIHTQNFSWSLILGECSLNLSFIHLLKVTILIFILLTVCVCIYFKLDNIYRGLPKWISGKESACQCRRHRRCGFNPWVRKVPWRRAWQPTPVFLPERSHGQRCLMGYSPWGRKELETTEWLCTHTIFTDVVIYRSTCNRLLSWNL